jgi:hypothetical protein
MNVMEAAELDTEMLLAGPQRESDNSGRDEVKEFLGTVLANGPVKAVDVLKEAEEAGIAERTLKRYKAAAKAE